MAEAAKASEKGGDKGAQKSDRKADKRPERSRGDQVASLRKTAATAIWVLAVIAALILAVGALLIALNFNPHNEVVHFFVRAAHKINFLGDLKTFSHGKGKNGSSVHDALVKTVLVNWGICAVVYLVVGKVLDRLIRP